MNGNVNKIFKRSDEDTKQLHSELNELKNSKYFLTHAQKLRLIEIQVKLKQNSKTWQE